MVDRQWDACSAQRSDEPERIVLYSKFECCAEFDCLHARIPNRQQSQIRNIARGSPTCAKLDESQSAQLLPAPCVGPNTATQPLEGPSGIAEHRGHRCDPARRSLPRRYQDLDFLDLAKSPDQAVDHRRRQCWYRACSGYSQQSSCAGCWINLFSKMLDEFSAIRQVNIMRTGCDRGGCHAIVLPLERPRTMNYQIGGKLPERPRKIWRSEIELYATNSWIRIRCGRIAPRCEDLKSRIT